MKFIPLGGKPNVSATRNGSANVSMKVDGRGLPHICWLENKNGHNEMCYRFWDGLQWTFHQHPIVGWAEEELVSSGNSLVLDSQEKPFISYSKRLPNERSIITVASTQKEIWNFNELEVDYDAKWVGLFTYDYSLKFSSSSSSSSSSIDSSSSSSSSSSLDSSSSSTSESSGEFEDYYCMEGFPTDPLANGTYYRTGTYFRERPVYFNGTYYLYYHLYFILGEYQSAWVIASTIGDTVDGVMTVGDLCGTGPTPITPYSTYWGKGDCTGGNYTMYIGPCSSSSMDSSSSSSFDSSSSSSTSNSSISSSSISSSSSSSSTSSSSSSSIDSSSSSSADDVRIFVVTYDSNNIMRIYGIRPSGWHLMTEKQMTISTISNLKHVNCGKYLGVTWYESDQIYYNFFDIETETWKYDETQILIIDGVIIMDVDGFYTMDEGNLLLALIIEKTSATQIANITVDTLGIVSYLGSGSIIESETVYVTGENDYFSSGYSDIAVSIDPITNSANIITLGGRLAKYYFDGYIWTKDYGSVEGRSSGISPDKLVVKSYNDIISMSFSHMAGDVYYFVEDAIESAFTTVYPYISVFNEQRFYIVKYKNGSLDDGVEIPCTWWERVGDILRESITRVNVIVVDGEDPLCYTSSSSSSINDTSESSLSESSLSSSSINDTSESSESSESSSSGPHTTTTTT